MNEADETLHEIANCFGSVVPMLSSRWHDFDGLAVTFGVSTEQLTATCEAAGIAGVHQCNKVTTSSFLVKNFQNCLSSCDDVTVEVSEFKKNVIEFCKCGSTTFMQGEQMGDQETFYLHEVRNHLLQIAEKVFKKHQIGLGVFTMQGFEHRNKQSKQLFKFKTNTTGNIVLQSIKALCNLFKFSTKVQTN